MSPNDKGVTYFNEQKENSMSLKDKEILTEKPPTTNAKRSWMPLQKGNPQGSSLGPFLFNIFMNNIFYLIDLCDLANYADDNTISIIASTMEVVLATLKHHKSIIHSNICF